MTAVYDRNNYLAEKRRALDAWSRLLEEITSNQTRHGNVIRIRSN